MFFVAVDINNGSLETSQDPHYIITAQVISIRILGNFFERELALIEDYYLTLDKDLGDAVPISCRWQRPTGKVLLALTRSPSLLDDLACQDFAYPLSLQASGILPEFFAVDVSAFL